MRRMMLVAVVWFAAGCPAARAESVADVVENSIGMKLVAVPAGEFAMGSNEFADERPVHTVRITKPFLLGQTEVTQGQFERVMEATPWRGEPFAREGENVAASYVSWEDALAFCRRLTELERAAGRRYRLPTEAEWEYACRAGTKTEFSFGDDPVRLGAHAWFDGNADGAGEKYAHEVARKAPNGWKLFDMHGNVYEWCADWYDDRSYAAAPAADPTGPEAGTFRVIRGGSWAFDAVDCRSADRSNQGPGSRYDGIGFRVVCEVD